MEEPEPKNEQIPRNYQVSLIKLALEQNTIIYLPTGSGKTFIAIMVMKHLGEALSRPYSDGGNLSFFLVNTIALVDQHAKYLRNATIFRVGSYCGEMNLDYWNRNEWEAEFNKHQVIVMTSQIFLNLIINNFIDLSQVNLVIFDECHTGVIDHSMRQIMKLFGNQANVTRIIGLTATLLNGNCKLGKVMDEVKALEISYNSKVATVDGLEDVVGYSTNPIEVSVVCAAPVSSATGLRALALLDHTKTILSEITILDRQATPRPTADHLVPLELTSILSDLRKLIEILKQHITMLGDFGGYFAAISQLIKIERIKKHCDDVTMYTVLNFAMTRIGCVKNMLVEQWRDLSEEQTLDLHLTDKVHKLLDILANFRKESQEELCALVFVKQRFTAKVLHHILEVFRRVKPNCSYIKSNFMVGNSNNPYKDTRENIFIAKKNRETLEQFINREFNVLICSNVLEEGVDIPKCTLVVRFDKSEDYRSYIQSKGRARYRKSLFYTIIESNFCGLYQKKYNDFQQIEKLLNDFLVGKNDERAAPSRDDVDSIRYEDALPPYYVDGENSAQVNMISAISLLSRYCLCLSTDPYTIYLPEWYIDLRKNDHKLRVVIIMPIACPIREPIEGAYMDNKKDAKRAAALKACIMLHKCGELNDNLLPVVRDSLGEEVNFLFKHWPTEKETAGIKNKRRLYDIQGPKCLKGPLDSKHRLYFHIIDLNPDLQSQELDNCVKKAYKSSLTFGFLTPNQLPKLCQFPIYSTSGTMNVTLDLNISVLSLTDDEIKAIKEFHFLVFHDVLEILRDFLVFDRFGANFNTMLVVPVEKNGKYIDFNVIHRHKVIRAVEEPTSTEKLSLSVDEEGYLHKIIIPWYRSNKQAYIVTEVCMDRTPMSPFPNSDFESFQHYYEEKHSKLIIKKDQALLLVKGLSNRLNNLKPIGQMGKRKRDKRYEEVQELLIPEMVTKQDFPADLWIQARLLPSIFHRITLLLKIYELQSQIANKIGANPRYLVNCPPLKLDTHLLHYEIPEAKPKSHDVVNQLINSTSTQLKLESSDVLNPQYNKDFQMKMMEAEYTWNNIDEPKDIERCLNVTILDVEIYENFIGQKVDRDARLLKNTSPIKSTEKTKLMAIDYPDDFEHKTLRFLSIQFDNQIPNLCDFYTALSAAESDDVVNLERLEILGDSFLKLIASLYILFKFCSYNEGKATALKGRLVSNKNLYYLAKKKNLGGILQNRQLSPKDEWVPPCFSMPNEWKKMIDAREMSVSSIFYANVPQNEQISGFVSRKTLEVISPNDFPIRDDEETSYQSVCCFLNKQYVADKTTADAVEALLGAFFEVGGIQGGVKFIEWLGLIPKSENLLHVINSTHLNPVVNPKCTFSISKYVPFYAMIEKTIGYVFKDRNYLLQALTHPSYSINRLTNSYERLEFIGDAILDFLITAYIYEHCGYLTPGQVTDLRSALVNNITFASLVVRYDFHKLILYINPKLNMQINKFADFMTMKNNVIDDEVLILLEAEDLNLGEYVDVPKILGDVFEALAGAVYLDSGKDLEVVWKVFYKLMYKEIRLFSNNVPKNVLRRLYECHQAYPKFDTSQILEECNNKTMIRLNFMCEGRLKSVYGFGTNKNMAKRAAAKMALRALNLK